MLHEARDSKGLAAYVESKVGGLGKGRLRARSQAI